MLTGLLSAIFDMIGSYEVEEEEEIDAGAMRAIEYGTKYQASFESEHFNSQNRRGMIKFDPAMAAHVLDPTCHDQRTRMNEKAEGRTIRIKKIILGINYQCAGMSSSWMTE